METYKAHLEIKKAQEEQKLKEKEIALKDKELEGKILDSHNNYISNFLQTALNQDIELRIRFAEYFAFVSDPRYSQNWEKFREGLERRRNGLRTAINQKEKELEKIRSRRTLLDVDEQTTIAQLGRELSWFYGELGYVRQDSNVSMPVLRTIDDFGKGFNGPLVPVTAAALSKVFGAPTTASLPIASSSAATNAPAASDPNSCMPIDGPKLVAYKGEFISSTGEKVELIKPAADSLRRIMSGLMQDDAELVKSLSFIRSQCANYNATRKTFDVSSWLVTVTFGGKYLMPLIMPQVLSKLIGISLGSNLSIPSDPFVLASLEKVARYFRDEQWYWEVEGSYKQANRFVVSASLFEKWVNAGEFK